MEPISINISDEILKVCPGFCFAAIQCSVKNTGFSEILWKEIDAFSSDFRERYKIPDINKRLAIFATRQVYKKLGKDPNRYRPSAEALCRRILKGMELYQIDVLVDLINLVSMKSGYSIGGFDADKIHGDLILGVGKKDERFEAIGRGLLNIEGLPVYRDEMGGIGTPTSDEERTKITSDTTNLLMLINGYLGDRYDVEKTVDYSVELLKKYAQAEEIRLYLSPAQD